MGLNLLAGSEEVPMKRNHVMNGMVVFGLLMFSVAATAQVTFDVRPLAIAGDPAEVPPTLVSASAPVLNDNGQILFTGDGRLLLTSKQGLIVVAAPGDSAPSGGLFSGFFSPSLNAVGDIVLGGFVQASSRTGIFLFSAGVLRPLVQVGDPSPDGGTFTIQNATAGGQALSQDPVED
jgi:hypothetical protein